MKYSIIVPVFNRPDEVDELLVSLLTQSFTDFEVIIVEDGSQKPCEDICKKYADRINLHYFMKPNSGPGQSRNYGAERAKGEYLLILDSDVVLPKDYLNAIEEELKREPADAFGGPDAAHESFTDTQKAISYSMTSVLTTGGIRGSKKAVSKFQPRSFNMGVNKDIFLKLGGFSEMRIGEDPDLSMKFWENGYKTQFYENIGVYHKRRSNISKFSKQVYQFGVARPILNQRHPQYVKITFWFPSLFLFGGIFSLLLYLFLGFGLFLALYTGYFLMIFIHATVVERSLFIGGLSVLTTMVQMFSYGIGFLESCIKLNVMRKLPQQAFPNHFYSEHKKEK